MGRLVLYLCLISNYLLLGVEAHSEEVWHKVWAKNAKSEADAIENLVGLLGTTVEGRHVLERAREKDPRFQERIFVGATSITESTYARTYSLEDGRESFSLQHKIYLGRNLTLADAVVDLAHELTHFALRDVLNPYVEGFSREVFIRHGIEGKGGELEAFEQECLVARAMGKVHAWFPRHGLCSKFLGSTGGFNRARARKDYYAVGDHLVPKDLQDELPELEMRKVVFVSSFAKMPYPLAMAREFRDTRVTVCKNNNRKIQLMAARGRAPASTQRQEEAERLRRYKELYCDASE